MRSFRISRVCALAALGLGLLTSTAGAGTVNPWDFNVYSLGDIGTSGLKYQSDFQGIAGAGGSTYFSSFSLHDIAAAGPGTPFSLYTGGDVQITGSIHNGGIEAAGSVSILGANVDGLISAGGDLLGTGGTVDGDVFLGGQQLAGGGVTINGTVTESTAFVPTVDLAAMSAFFLNASDVAGNLSATTAFTNSFGELQISAVSGLNVVNIDAASLSSAWGVEIDGPSDAIIILNVDDAAVAFDSLTWEYLGGASSGNTLLNLPSATDFDLSGGDHQVNILAPLAQTNFAYGLVTGNLVVGSLTGGGQVNAGRFEGGTRVPEPTGAALVCLGLTVLSGKRFGPRTCRA